MDPSSHSVIEKVVYFVRHGESEDNITPVFQGPDSHLSEVGRRQAKTVAERVSALSFDVLIASPLLRAQQTAEEVARATGKEISYSDLFVERIKPSSINGKPLSDQKAYAVWEAWNQSMFTNNRVEDGEHFSDLMTRIDAALEHLLSVAEHRIVVVTHGYFLRALVARALFGESLTGELFEKWQNVAATENTGLTVMSNDGAWKLHIYNDHAHLAE